MDKHNPVGTGSFSMNRLDGSTTGPNSTTLGKNCTASGANSVAEGDKTIATGSFGSHSEGFVTTASGKASHAEGSEAEASGDYSHAEGHNTTASKIGAHAEGHSTTASGNYSHAEGESTTASGNYSHAEGESTTASARASHAEGKGTYAQASYQHVQGKYNIQDSTNAHIVGNGESADAKSNAHTLDWNGNAWFAGDVYVDSTSGTNKDGGSKKLATEEYVTNLLSSAGGAFYAAYGTTTNAEIKAAYDAGKVILCAYETRIYRLYTIPTGSNTIYFTSEYDYDGEIDTSRHVSVTTSD
jgi:hypothetical protein